MSKRTCEHIQADGLRCFNPAMYRRQVCYHHWRLLRPSAPVCDPAYVPPTFDCEASVSLMTAHLLRCVLAGKIDLKRAQVAMTCVRETAKSLRLQGKVDDHVETSFTAFMADYFSSLDEIQAKSAAAYPDPQPLIYPAHFADLPEDDDPPSTTAPVALSSPAPSPAVSSQAPAPALSSRAPVVRGEGSASSAGEQSASTSNDVDNVDTGFQARVPRVQLATSTTTNNPTHHNSPDNRRRAGLQPRVAHPEKPRASAPVHAPVSAEPQVGEHHNSCDNRGRAGLQPRVAHPEKPGASAPVHAPVSAEPQVGEHHNSSDSRGRAGLQPRVSHPEKPGALAPVEAPISAEPQVGEHHNSSHNRGRAGLQPRVVDPEKSGALAPVAPPRKPPLSATQLKLMKKILRRGPSHPRFPEATRLLDHHIATNSA